MGTPSLDRVRCRVLYERYFGAVACGNKCGRAENVVNCLRRSLLSRWGVVILWIGGACSCTFYDRTSTLELAERSAKLELTFNRKNFRVVKSHVEGVASCPHLIWLNLPEIPVLNEVIRFPIISVPLGDPNLHERAMGDLHRQHDMRGKAQVLYNVSDEVKITNYLFLFASTSVRVSADIIEYVEEEPEARP
jgi:hypothetical protein